MPVITAPKATGNTLALPLLSTHVPPVTVALSVVVAASHTIALPSIRPACGSGLMVTGSIATSVPHELVTEYIAVSMPALMPVITFCVVAGAIRALALLIAHVPLLTLAVRVSLLPSHTTAAPVIAPACGSGLMVMAFLTLSVPQALVIVYTIVSMPALTPITTPPPVIPVTVAWLLVAVHVPPLAVSISVSAAASQTTVVPVIAPACGTCPIVTTCDVTNVPHELVSA